MGVVAVAGLALAVIGSIAVAITGSSWAVGILGVGLTAASAYLVATVRVLLLESRTIRANIGRAQQSVGQQISQSSQRLQLQQQGLARATTQLEARLTTVESALTAVSESGASHAAALKDLHRRVNDSSTGVTEQLTSLGASPVIAVWRDLSGHRKEGVCCLMIGDQDAATILALDNSPAPLEVWDPADASAAPRVPAHAVGAVLVDLDAMGSALSAHRGSAAGATELETFFRWLRADVPVFGFTRQPRMLVIRAAALSEVAQGMLFPVPISTSSVRFNRPESMAEALQKAALETKDEKGHVS